MALPNTNLCLTERLVYITNISIPLSVILDLQSINTQTVLDGVLKYQILFISIFFIQ